MVKAGKCWKGLAWVGKSKGWRGLVRVAEGRKRLATRVGRAWSGLVRVGEG